MFGHARVDVKLVTDAKLYQKLVSKPSFIYYLHEVLFQKKYLAKI